MDKVSFLRKRIDSALGVVAEIHSMDFPHDSAKKALTQIENNLRDGLEDIISFNENSLPSEVSRWSYEGMRLINRSLLAAGIIVNSANVRNSFEVHYPLELLTQKLLGPEVHLVISFEWKYIPFTYTVSSILPGNYVFIGLPASEATNVLSLPISGHELGHSIWKHGEFQKNFQSSLKSNIIDLIISSEKYKSALKANGVDIEKSISRTYEIDYRVDVWAPSYKMAMKQIEEIFCDAVGLFIFGGSYLWSYVYFLSPNILEKRSEFYPGNKDRALYLQMLSQDFGIPIPKELSPSSDGFPACFEVELEKSYPSGLLAVQLSIADESVKRMINSISGLVKNRMTMLGINVPDVSISEKICENFMNHIPFDDPKGIGEVLDGAWRTYIKSDFMVGASDRQKTNALTELSLKTIEMLEIIGRTEG